MTLYVNGKQAVSSKLASGDDASHIVRLGYTATDFMPPFKGEIDEVQLFKRVLSVKDLTDLAEGNGPEDAVASWSFDGVKGAKIRNTKGSSYEGTNQGAKLVEGRSGQALQFSGNAQVLIAGKAKGAKRSAAISPNANEPVIAAAVLGDTGLWNLKDEENLRLRIPASTKAQKLRVLIWSGKRGEVADFSKAVAVVQAEDEAPNLMKLTEGGKAKWTETALEKSAASPRLPLQMRTRNFWALVDAGIRRRRFSSSFRFHKPVSPNTAAAITGSFALGFIAADLFAPFALPAIST
jgi:hypothetical protein